MRTTHVRIYIVLAAAALGAGGCGSDSGPTRRVSASGTTCCISVDEGNTRAAYLLNAVTAVGGKGELHVTDKDGNDRMVAAGVSPRSFVMSPKGKALLWTTLLGSGADASLSWLDLSTPNAQPKVLFDKGLPTQRVTPGLSSSPQYTAPMTSVGFFTPSGRYFIMGVTSATAASGPDLHVLDVESGTDVFQRGYGAFYYLEAALPDDTMIFQDAVGGNSGVTGPPGVQTLFWVSLPAAGSMQPVEIDKRTANMTFTADNKAMVYQRVDRALYVWDAVGRGAPTKLADDTVQFAVGEGAGGPVAYTGVDHSVHVVGLDGSAKITVAAANANADTLGPVIVSADSADVYWFQKVETQNRRGTLMHAGAGGAAAKIADNASIYDVRPVPGGLLFLQNVDDLGQFGDAMRAARDGSGATALGNKVPTAGIGLAKLIGNDWFAAHLTQASYDKDRKLVDTEPAIVGALALASSAGGADAMIDPATRVDQFAFTEDQKGLFYIGGATLDTMIANYVGGLFKVSTSSPSMKMSSPILKGASELSTPSGNTLFCNAPKAETAGVYYVKLDQ